MFTSRIRATIGEEGDMIGWEDDHNTVGPVALRAKQSLLRFIPHMLPAGADESSLYRLVLDHGDFGIHNMSIIVDADGRPGIMSLYDWETGYIVPAILSDPEMAVLVDLVTDAHGAPSITRVGEDETPEYHKEYMRHASQYIKVQSPPLDKASLTDKLAAVAIEGPVQVCAILRACHSGWERRPSPMVFAETLEG
jgi:hypothetical protein